MEDRGRNLGAMTDPTDPADEQASDLPGFPDLSGGGLAGLLEQAQQAMSAQQDLAEREVEGVAGGGVVRIRATGAGEVLSVSLAPEVVDPDDVAMLEDLVVAALHDLHQRMVELQQEAMGGFGDLLGGSGFGDLLGGTS